ncbi:MAG: glycine--tRNA ligase [Bacilli bacterium]
MVNFDDLVKYAKKYGFVYSGSEIYGGLANTWDYGPLGVELKNNIKKAWWDKFVKQQRFNVGLDSAILMNPNVWVASGHVGGFSDPLIDCKSCNNRFRADKLVENFDGSIADGWDEERLKKYIVDNEINCPECGNNNYTDIRQFNLMFKTEQGVVSGKGNDIYMRPETAQGIFVNFKNVARTTRKKIPFGICQIGKSFRNEITPGNFIFRTREFEQMELEFFCKPGNELEWFKYWKEYCINFLNILKIDGNNLRLRDHDDEELSHYSNATSDIEFKFPFGWGELWGIASRTDFDLTAHQNVSKENLEYFDQVDNSKYLPFVIEPSVGVDRLFLAILFDAYTVSEEREFLDIHPYLAPIKVSVLPLMKKYHSEKAEEVFEKLSKHFMCEYDDSGSIGKRYLRSDAIGIPFCVTIDDNTVNDATVTIRDLKTTEQITLSIDECVKYITSRIQL